MIGLILVIKLHGRGRIVECSRDNMHELAKTGRSFTRFSIKSILQNPVYLIADKDAYQYFVDNEAELFAPESDFDGIPTQSQEKGQVILHKL